MTKALLNAIVYLVNKAAFQLIGENSRTISRLSAKYIVDYLHSLNMLDKNNLDEESVRRAFLEDLKICEDLDYSENNGQAVLKIINPVLRESIVKLNEEKIPICIAPGIIYVYLINDMKNQKVSFQKVEFHPENNYSLWIFKIMS
ncbi:MAG: hypothetical protein PQ964_00315 [Methanobacteriaceae archaeon]|jgi:hypothetical protein